MRGSAMSKIVSLTECEPILVDDLTSLRLRLENATSVNELIDVTFELVQAFGAINLCYAHAPPLGATDYKGPAIIQARGMPKGWGGTYLKNEYEKVDPVSRMALTQLRPFYWRDIGKMKSLSTRERGYISHLKEIGIDNGICVPTFGPKGRSGYFGIGFCPTQDRVSDKRIQILQWLCQTSHICHCAMVAETLEAGRKLSTREVDVLRLILYGLSNPEIARRLDVSDHSVSTYLKRASEKVGATGRFEAATRALTIGLLD